jgi:hypothetical protein
MSRKLTKSSLGKNGDNFLTDTVKFVKREVAAVDRNLEAKADKIAMSAALLGGALGVVVGIVGTKLFERYITPPAVIVTPPVPPRV